jgi:predicted transglutaminase-like cysteine proteinase
MRERVFVFAGALAAAAFGALLSSASIPSASAASLKPGGKTSKPFGHHEFCKSNPGECRALVASSLEQLTPARMKKLRAINAAVNRSIKPVSDSVQHKSKDVWSVGGKAGDCEDFALAKRRKLIAAGFKPGNLRLAMGWLPHGEAHLVLVVRAEQDDYVLDNLHDDVRPWKKSGVRLTKMQGDGAGHDWVKVGG